jgi:outer membrane protein W
MTLTARANVFAQESTYSVFFKFSYTTSSKIFLHPNSPDILLRGTYLSVDNIYGYGVDLRRKVSDTRMQIGLAVDYISKMENFDRTRTKDGFWALPLELTGYFYIPVLEGDVKIFLGGGLGYYLGERTYYLSGTKAPVIDKCPGAGIHILGGVDYYFNKNFGMRSQLKFRDVQFKTTSKMLESNLGDLESQINIDGMTLEIGVVYAF